MSQLGFRTVGVSRICREANGCGDEFIFGLATPYIILLFGNVDQAFRPRRVDRAARRRLARSVAASLVTCVSPWMLAANAAMVGKRNKFMIGMFVSSAFRNRF